MSNKIFPEFSKGYTYDFQHFELAVLIDWFVSYTFHFWRIKSHSKKLNKSIFIFHHCDLLLWYSCNLGMRICSSFIPSIRRLSLRDLSSNSINFAETSFAFSRSSSTALTSVFKFLISSFTWNSSSSILFLRKFQTSS